LISGVERVIRSQPWRADGSCNATGATPLPTAASACAHHRWSGGQDLGPPCLPRPWRTPCSGAPPPLPSSRDPRGSLWPSPSTPCAPAHRIGPARWNIRPSSASAVAKNSPSCWSTPSTGIAIPPPEGSTPRLGAAFRQPCGTTRSSDFCWVISFRPLVLRPTAHAEPSRSHRVSALVYHLTVGNLEQWHGALVVPTV